MYVCICLCDCQHSLAGVSRSSTIVVAYLMSVTDLDYRTLLDAVRGARSCASPNFGFQRQLLTFEYEGLQKASCRRQISEWTAVDFVNGCTV